MKKSIYMASVLLLLVVLAVAAFIVEQNRNSSEEEAVPEDKYIGTDENIMSEEGMDDAAGNPVLTVYGELSREELVEHMQTTIVRIEAEASQDGGDSVTLAGSGVILEIEDSYIDIVTASHVVEQTAAPLVYFSDGQFAYGSVLAYGKQSDVAFVRVEVSEMQNADLTMLQPAKCADNETYAALQSEESVYMIGSVGRVAGDVVQGEVKAKELFVELFQNEMLVCTNPVAGGMSGGGIFCTDGKMIGIIVGTNETDTVGVTITDVLAEYRSISE